MTTRPMTMRATPDSSATGLPVEEHVPLAPLTTLGVGGPARYFVRCPEAATLITALAWASARDVPTFVLGGGSNVLVADAGFDGLVLSIDDDAFVLEDTADEKIARARVGAGADWSETVRRIVDAGLGGVECLAGIPGRIGAAPIQNIGAYGQEVAETIETVHVVERTTGEHASIAAADCGFGYRDSFFKRRWRGRYVVVGVDFLLPRTDVGTVLYGELARHLADRADLADRAEPPTPPTPAEVRDAVLDIRRGKSMLIGAAADPDDPNQHSAGSFFVNPVLSPLDARRVRDVARRRGAGEPPAFPAPDGQVKLSAAWLIEAAGFSRGYIDAQADNRADDQANGRAGLSTRHALALINRGGATAADLLGLARRIRRAVRDRFDVTLVPEPILLGFESTTLEEPE